jgi:hypothetical protein
MVPPIGQQALYPVYDQEGNLVSTLAVGIDPASTVKSHVIHIFNKLGVSDRTQAAVTAARLSLI